MQVSSDDRPATGEGLGTVRATLGWAAVAVLIAYAVASGEIALRHNSDSLIPIFVSLESWTPFYWGQNRFGMLVPLLALPVRDSLWNLIVQNGLSALLLLTGTAALSRHLGVRWPSGIAIALVAVIVTFSFDNLKVLLLTTNQSYSPALGLCGLAVGQFMDGSPGRILIGGALMVLGAWVNAGVALFTVCLCVALCASRATRPLAIRLLIAALVAIAAHKGLQTLISDRLLDVTGIHLVPVGAIPAALTSLWLDVIHQTGAGFLFVVGALWLAAGLWTVRGPDQDTARRVLWAIAIGSVAYAVVMTILFRGVGRHMSPVFVVALVAPMIILHRAGVRGLGAPAVAAIAALTVVAQTGIATPRSLRQDLVATLGLGRAEVAFKRGVRAVTGNYWDVWTVTFATNLLHERAMGARPVLPVAMRAERLIGRARDLPRDARVLVVPSGDVSYWRSLVRVPLGSAVSEFGTFSITYVATEE